MIRKLAPLLVARRGARRSPRPARPRNRRPTLEGYAADTWHSFDLMLYPATGLAAGQRLGRGRPRPLHVADQHRHVPVEHDRRARPRDHLARRGAPRGSTRRSTRSRRSSATSGSGQFYNWYDPQTGAEADRLAGRRRARSTRSSRASTTAGCAAALVMVANAVPAAARAGARARRLDGLRLLLRPGRRA